MQCSHLNGQVKHADCLITTVGRENHIWINLCWIWVFSGKFKYLQICCIHPSSTSYRDLRAAVWAVTHSCSQLLQFFCGDTRCSQTSRVTVSPACPLFASESPTGNTTSPRRHPGWHRAHQPFSERDHSVIIHFVHINQKMWTIKQRSTGDATMFTMDKEKISYITWLNKRHESRSQKDPAAIFLSVFDSEYPDSFPGASVIMRPSDAITAQADTHRTGTVTPFLRRQYICESSSTDKTSHGTNNSQETVGNSSTTCTWQHYRQHRKHGNSPHVCCKL